MGLTTGQYGMVVSSFAFAKMVGNVPSAILVERHGRKVSGLFRFTHKNDIFLQSRTYPDISIKHMALKYSLTWYIPFLL